MNIENIPVSLIIFIISQAITAVCTSVWSVIRIHFVTKHLQQRVETLENENLGLRDEVKELRESLNELAKTLLVVKSNTDLIVEGKIKIAHHR